MQKRPELNVVNNVASSMGFIGVPLTDTEIESQFPRSITRQISLTLWSALSKTASAHVELCEESKLQKKVLLSQALWFFVFIGHGVSHWIALVFSGIFFVNDLHLLSMIFNVASLPGLVVTGWIVDKFPRMHLLRAGLFLVLLSLVSCACFAVSTTNAVALVLWTCVFQCMLCVCWAALSLSTAESFSTSQRAGVASVCTAGGMLGSIVVGFSSAFFLQNDLPAETFSWCRAV